jgi:hypothetical protein
MGLNKLSSIQYKLFSGIISKLPLKLRLRVLFFRRFRYFLDYTKASTFNEKLQIRKICDRDNLLTIAADKIKSKEFVKKITSGVYIPRTLWIGCSMEDIISIDFANLPSDYVFKANHTSQTIKIIRNNRHLSLNEMKALTASWLKHDQATVLGEWAYKNIPRRIFIEEFLDFEGHAPDDYKFFVYHGNVHYIQLDSDRFRDHKRNMFDREWNELNFEYSHPRKKPAPKKPAFLEQMIIQSEKIGANFDFVRVDLYFYQNKITFGELTIYPGAGFERFPDKKWDYLFGQPWVQIYNKN